MMPILRLPKTGVPSPKRGCSFHVPLPPNCFHVSVCNTRRIWKDSSPGKEVPPT
ncbi:hypothetical protein VTK73DRAFT_4558 [Phialemonium thermophilum]|uniref:Uncharacterized protein n=1 Tax=Phialemonium thermophilum TaxID=223376 RepID=A0ABR3V9I4_9PEZI